MTCWDIVDLVDKALEYGTGIDTEPDAGIVGLLQLLFAALLREAECSFGAAGSGWNNHWYVVADEFVAIADTIERSEAQNP